MQSAEMEVLLVLGACALIVLLVKYWPKQTAIIIRAEPCPIDKVQPEMDADYKREQQREEASLRRWRRNLIPLDIGILCGWSLQIDHRRQHPTPKFRPVQLEGISYDKGSGLYLIGQCLRRNEKRHFGMDRIYGFADASSNQEFASFEEWAAHQGVMINLQDQVEEIEKQELEAFWAAQNAEINELKSSPLSDQD